MRQLRSDVQREGGYVKPGKGSHQKWKHPLVPDMELILSGNDGDDAKPYQERQVQTFLAAIREARRQLP